MRVQSMRLLCFCVLVFLVIVTTLVAAAYVSKISLRSALRQIPLFPLIIKPDLTDVIKQEKVKEMFSHAWKNYELYAWGANELRPISKSGNNDTMFGTFKLGTTIVGSMDTLYIMGFMDEFERGREWIAQNLNFSHIDMDLSMFETNIRFVGGLLTCYSLTGDAIFREKAVHIVENFLPAFETPTGIPYSLINPVTKAAKNYKWANEGFSILSEIGTLYLEFSYLSDVTGDPKYLAKVEHIRDFLNKKEKPNGLYPIFLDPKTGNWGPPLLTLGAFGDSFYEYLLKTWLQSGQNDPTARQMFDNVIEAVLTHLVCHSRNGLTFITEMKNNNLDNKMEDIACFAGGMFALAARNFVGNLSMKYWDIAEGLTSTCHEAYNRSKIGLGPKVFRFTDKLEAQPDEKDEKFYILRPEVVESYFYMWRLTKSQIYRDWGWEVVQALEKYCRTDTGYSGIKNVYEDPPQKDDIQQNYFLAETLKYLFLLFSDDSVLPLDQWVFNTGGHPLPIKNANPLYRLAYRL